MDAILESAEVRQANQRGQGLVVAGCLTQRFRDELPRLLPEVDAFMGIDQVGNVAQIIREALKRRAAKLAAPPAVTNRKKAIVGRLAELSQEGEPGDGSASKERKRVTSNSAAALVSVNQRPTYIPDYATPRFRLTPRHFAYLKIAEGCNHPCSFCIIPRMRGSHRSRTQADIVTEAKHLLAEGVKELNLISQDSTYYGLDLRPNHSRAIAAPERFKAAVRTLPVDATTICTLLRELNALPGEGNRPRKRARASICCGNGEWP